MKNSTVMYRYTLSAVAMLVLLFAGRQPAQAQVGEAAAIFLQIEPDSRAAAMGNANVALADNANAVYWNPAGLARQEGLSASITHSQWLPQFNAGLFYDYLVGKYHVENLGTFGGHVTYFNLGEHEQRTGENDLLGRFSAYELAIGTSFGTTVSEHFDVGAGMRLIYSNLTGSSTVSVGAQETHAGVSAGFDLAGMYRSGNIELGSIGSEIRIGANLANMGPQIQYSDREQSDPIPTNLRVGWAWEFQFDEYNSLTIANDFNKMLVDSDSTGAKPWYQALVSSWQSTTVDLNPNDDQVRSLNAFQQMTIATGLEYWYNDLFALRSGYFYEHPYYGNREFMTFGAGVRYSIVGVDFSYIYALEENHPLSNTIRFSLLIDTSRR